MFVLSFFSHLPFRTVARYMFATQVVKHIKSNQVNLSLCLSRIGSTLHARYMHALRSRSRRACANWNSEGTHKRIYIFSEPSVSTLHLARCRTFVGDARL